MICKNCGKEIADGAKFCGACGTAASEILENDQVVSDADVNNKNVAENANNQPYFAQPEFNEPVKKPRKKLIAIICAVVAVVLVAAVVLGSGFEAIQGTFVKAFGSDADYLRYVENKAFGAVTSEISAGYGTGLEALDGDNASELSVKLNVGDKAVSLLENSLNSYSNTSLDLDWLDTVVFDMNVNVKNNIEQVMAALNIDGKTFIDMDLIMDMDNGAAFIALLSLSDKYLKSDISLDEDYADMMEVYSDFEYEEILPSESEFDGILDKYIDIVIANLNDVEKKSDVLEISGVEQKLTALEIVIDQKDVINIATDLLEAVKDDKEIKKYIEDIAKYLEEKDLVTNTDEAYDEFCYLIDDTIAELKDIEVTDEGAITLVDYVNSNHEIVGRKFEFDGEEILHYATVRDGKKFAFEFEVEEFVVVGEGTDKSNTVNAEYAIKYDNEKICDIIVTDYKTNSDYLNGKLRIEPSSKLLDSMGLGSYAATAISVADPALELNFENKKDSLNFDMNLVSGDEVFVGFTVSTDKTKASNVKLPNSKDVYSQGEILEWVKSFDTEGLRDKLEDLGISSDFITAFEELLYPSYDSDYITDFEGAY